MPLTEYVRWQQNLNKDLNSKALAVFDTHWESMTKLSCWFKTNRVKVLTCLNKKELAVTPTPSWQIQLIFIQRISTEDEQAFRTLDELTTAESQQRQGWWNLRDVYVRSLNASGPQSTEDAIAVDLAVINVS